MNRASVSHLQSTSKEHTYADYSSVEDTTHLMHFLSPNYLVAKLDIKETRRIYLGDCKFLGVQWSRQGIVDYKSNNSIPSINQIIYFFVMLPDPEEVGMGFPMLLSGPFA